MGTCVHFSRSSPSSLDVHLASLEGDLAVGFPPAVRLPPPTSRMAGTTDCLRIVIHFTKTKRVRLHELQNLPIDPWPLRLHQVQYKRLPLRRRRVQVPDRRVQPALSFQSVAN